MSFLRCIPTVFVIGAEYEVLLMSNDNGLLWLEIDGVKYYEENSGVLYTEKKIAKIRVAQFVLDKAKKYSVCFKRSVDRKQYYSILGEEERREFSFNPVACGEELNVYHFADVHGKYNMAKSCIKAFEKRVDLIVFNGDIGEMQTEDDYYNICTFLGEMAKGSIPVVFTRGNHDTRGRLAEWYEKFFPCQNKKFFYTFTIGNLTGIVLDCGEDKVDSHIVYGGTNNFEAYRREQLQFLRGLNGVDDTKWLVAITHICPVKTTIDKGDEFDIERELYAEWNKELERIGTAKESAVYIDEDKDKFLVPYEGAFSTESCPVQAMFILKFGRQEEVSITEAVGAEKFTLCMGRNMIDFPNSRG